MQSEPEAEEEEQGESGGEEVQLDTRRGQDGIEGVGGKVGISSAGRGEEKPGHGETSPGNDLPVDDSAVVQPPTLQQKRIGGAVEGETLADQDGGSNGVDVDVDIGNGNGIGIGIGENRSIEACELEESGDGQPNQGSELHRDGMDDEQPQTLHRELRDGGGDERISSGGTREEEGGESVESGYGSETFDGAGDTSVRSDLIMIQIRNKFERAQGW